MMGQDDASVPTAHLHNPRPYGRGISHPIGCGTENIAQIALILSSILLMRLLFLAEMAYSSSLSIQIVTGPSLQSSTCIIAPKMPSATVSP